MNLTLVTYNLNERTIIQLQTGRTPHRSSELEQERRAINVNKISFLAIMSC